MPARKEARTALRGSEALRRLVEKEAPPPVVLLLGDDRRDLEDALSALVARVVPHDLVPLSLVRLRGADDTVQDVVAASQTLPMLGDMRMVVVREPEKLRGDPDGLVAYVRDPCPTTCLALVPAVFDKRLRLSTALLEHAMVVTFEAPADDDLDAWVRRTLSSRGVTVDDDAMDLLVDLVQAETLLLANELEKLGLAAAQTSRVTRSDVEALLGRTRTIDVWALTNAIEDADPARALAALRRLREQGAAVPYLVAMLDWCLGRLFSADDPKAPPQRRRALEGRRRAVAGRGEELYGLLRAADRLLRTTGGSVDGALERAVLAASR